MPNIISENIPPYGRNLANFTGIELIDRIGEEVIKNLVTSILCGGNVRSLTEGLTRRRLFLSNASMLITYLQSLNSIEDFEQKLSRISARELKVKRLSKEDKLYLQWLIGLTGKSIQNVLRGSSDEMENYLKVLEDSLSESERQVEELFGDLNALININDKEYSLTWRSILQIFAAIGAQTLAIRGSEKSMYGKLFEKLVLGTVLEILGFKLIDPDIITENIKVFWLSQRENKRESDATILIKPGEGVRFDIGFIGPENTEISLDKVSRFEREMEFGRQLHYMSTIILVDRIGEGSRITDLAENIEGHVVQMSMGYWVWEVARILSSTTSYSDVISNLTRDNSLSYIRQKMNEISLNKYIKS